MLRKVVKEKTGVEMRWGTIVLPILISITILIAVFYYQFERISLNMLERMNRDFLNQSDSIFSYINNIVSVTSSHIVADENITTLMYSDSPQESEIIKGTRALENISGYGSSIHSIYIYNPTSGYFYTTSNAPSGDKDNFYDQSVFELFSYGTSGPHYRYIAKPYSRGLEEVNTYIICDYYPQGEEKSVVVINLYANWLDSLLEEMFQALDVMVINEQGRIIGKTLPLDKEEQQSIERLIRTRTSDAGRFVVGTMLNKELYLYSSFGDDWCIVRRISWLDTFRELEKMKAYTYIGLVFAVVLVAVFGFLNTLKYFKPLKKIEESMKTMKVGEDKSSVEESVDKLIEVSVQYEQNYMKHIKDEYMRQLLEREKESDSSGELKTYIAPLDYSRPFYILLLSKDDKNLVNKVENLLPLNLFIHLKDHKGLFFHQENMEMQSLEAVLKEYGAYASLSNPILWLENIHLRYERVREALSYTLFASSDYRLYSEELVDEKIALLPEKNNQESKIVVALSNGEIEEAEKNYKEYMDNIQLCHISYAAFLLKRLYMASQIDASAIDDEVLSEIDYILTESLDKTRLDEIFHLSFKKKVESVLENRETRSGKMVENVKKYIKENYTNPGLSLKMIADTLDMNAVYLGKLFRKECGHSVSDYINKCRLEKAKELLSKTDLTIKDIVSLSGIPNVQYFYTLFKNYTGKSPTVWREDERHK